MEAAGPDKGSTTDPPTQDQISTDYLRALQILVSTIRDQYETRPHSEVTTQLRLAEDADELRSHLRRPADLLIYGGHTILVDGAPCLASRRGRLDLRDLRGNDGSGIDAAGLVLDCCYGSHPAFDACLERRTAVLFCDGMAPYTHGPLLLPNLLAGMACPQRPIAATVESMLKVMEVALSVVPRIWRGQWARWTAEPRSPDGGG
jgi:hypothetical protein